MIVSEPIDELKQYNPNAEVTCVDSETIELSFIDFQGQYDKSNTPIEFIERRDYVEEDD